MIKVAASLLLIGVFVTVSCSKKEFKCPYEPCSITAPYSEVQQIEAYLSSNGLTAVKHCSGLFYIIENPGTGATPTGCSSVSVNYSGRLTNGNIFDHTTTPVSFSLLQLIEGWKNGLPLIKKGGKIKLFIPPSLGYGPNPNGSIPGNSILIFDIDLIDVQ